MANIEAYKMDGLGNDFLIIDRRKKFIDLSKEKIVSLGKRDNFGFDQVIFHILFLHFRVRPFVP